MGYGNTQKPNEHGTRFWPHASCRHLYIIIVEVRVKLIEHLFRHLCRLLPPLCRVVEKKR